MVIAHVLNNSLIILIEATFAVGDNRKRYQQSRNADQKSIETVFSIAFCRQCGDKWQSKTLFLTIFDLRSSIVVAFSIAAYPLVSRLCHLDYRVIETAFGLNNLAGAGS